jgi:hypothetical protein
MSHCPVPELIELPADPSYGATANVSHKERFAKRMVRSESSTRRPSRTVSTRFGGLTSRNSSVTTPPPK